MSCGICFYSELIDGTSFCNYLEKDVGLNDICNNYVNVYRLKEILVENNKSFCKQLEEEDDSGKSTEMFLLKYNELL